jgi:hypothetical protein
VRRTPAARVALADPSARRGHGERDEKAWEAAAAKGHRPCPVCRALTDLGGPKVFRAYAFEVSDDDLRAARDAQRRPARAPAPARGGAGDVMNIDDSDDELDGMKGKGKGKAKEEKKAPKRDPLDFDMSDDELELPDLQTLIKGATQPAAKVEKKPAKPTADEDEDDEDEVCLRVAFVPRTELTYNRCRAVTVSRARVHAAGIWRSCPARSRATRPSRRGRARARTSKRARRCSRCCACSRRPTRPATRRSCTRSVRFSRAARPARRSLTARRDVDARPRRDRVHAAGPPRAPL